MVLPLNQPRVSCRIHYSVAKLDARLKIQLTQNSYDDKIAKNTSIYVFLDLNYRKIFQDDTELLALVVNVVSRRKMAHFKLPVHS